MHPFVLTLLLSERPKLHTILAFLSAVGLNQILYFRKLSKCGENANFDDYLSKEIFILGSLNYVCQKHHCKYMDTLSYFSAIF